MIERVELKRFADRVLDALTARDPSQLPAAADVRYTENGQPLALGKGLWRTFGSVGGYRIEAADPATGQAVYHGLVIENGIPGLLTLRVRVTETEIPEIAEIEAIIVRAEKAGASVGVTGSLSSYTMFAPRPPCEFDPPLLGEPDPIWAQAADGSTPVARSNAVAVADAYFDAIQAGPSVPLPIASGCERQENGVTTRYRSGYVASVRRRHLVLDEERELLFGVYLLDHPGTLRPDGEDEVPQTYRVPSSFLAPHLFKIRDHGIVRVESTVKPVPYKMPFGWD